MDGTLDEWAQPVVDPETRAYIYSLVTALGGSSAEEDGQYVLGDDALACLKDLRRWVKFYDERLNRLDVARCLAEANLVKGDLLEILASWPEDKTEDRLRSKIALTCLELLVPLTWPQEIEDDQFTVNHHRHLNYIQLAQVDYKRTILTYDRAKILRTIVRVGLPSMALPKSERTARDEGIIRLMIYFFRNIAMISQPQHLPNSGDDAEISRSALVDAFHEQDILQVLLTLASSTGVEYALQDVVVLETLFHLLKGVDPRKLMMEDGNLAKSNTNELRGLIQKEKAMLADQARNGPTRHNRWSSMIWVKRDGEKISTVSGQDAIANAQRSLQKMDKSKKWNKPRQARRNKEEAGQNVFDVPISLTASARKRLRNFVEEFLDSSFNPLFSHLRKALESESSRVLRIHSMQYFYLVSWFLQAETARRSRIREQRKKKGSLTQEEDESFALVASVLNQETFVLLSRFMQQSQDAKEWQHLNAGMKCFTQILLTVQDMSESALEDDQEIAENIQNRVFYEQYTHDQVISIVRDYKGQGFGYLNACTELAHVFLRMLERHSKQNVDMQVRSRRRARKKRKQAEKPAEDEDGVGDGNESENDDIREAHQTSSERKFEFSRFAAKFMNQGCIETFVTFIKFYRDLSVEQLKRAHRFFYRCAFKMELAVLLFRVDILHLFYKMVKGPDGLDRDSPCFKDWEEFSRQLFRRVVKKVDSRPELFVEMLFSKIPATLYYLEHGYEKEVPTKAPRPPAELEVKPGMDLKDRIGVAVSVLVNQQKSDALNWAKGILFKAEEQRRTWEQQQASQATNPEANGETNGESISQPQSDISTDGEPQPQSPSSQERSPAPSITVHPDNEERRVSLFKDNKLRLLLTLLGFTLLSDPSDPVAVWTIPSTLSASDLAEKLSWIRAFEFDPPTYEEGKSAEDYLRSVKAAARSRGQSDDEGEAQWGDDSEGEEDFEFPANLRTKNPNSNDKSKPKRHLKRRPRKELDDDERAAREQARKQKDLEKRRKIKSELYVHDSDEENDEEADREFFAREEALRNKTGADHIKALTQKGIEEKGSKKRKAGENGKSSSKKRKSDEESAGETDDETQENGAVLLSSRETSPEEDVLTALGPESGEESDADTPLSSQHKSSRRGSAGDIDIATKEPTTTQDTDMVDLDQESEEDAPIMKPRPTQRRMRAGFVIDSDSE